MPGVACIACLVFFLVAFVWRGWLQYRRTGDHGFRGLAHAAGWVDWVAGALFVLATVAAPSAALLGLTGTAAPLEFFDRPPANALGIALVGIGFAVSVTAQLQMGASWRVGVDPDEATAMIAHGLFGHVRNPIYTGVLVWLIGMFFLVPNMVALSALVAAIVGLEMHVRWVEEPHLTRVHGERYVAYARNVGRFIPGIGCFR